MGGREEARGPGGVSSPQQLLGCFLMLAPMHTMRDKKRGGNRRERGGNLRVQNWPICYMPCSPKVKETSLFGGSPTCRWLSRGEEGKEAARVGLVPPYTERRKGGCQSDFPSEREGEGRRRRWWWEKETKKSNMVLSRYSSS